MATVHWIRGWFPEIKAAAMASLLLSLAFPPFATDNSPGQTAFLGFHSIFTQEAGYISLSRLGLLAILILATAAVAQFLAELLLRRDPSAQGGRPMFFGSEWRDGSQPFEGSTLATLMLALPIWLLLCGALVGRSRIMGLELQLAYFACVVFQLVVLSRLLPWITRERVPLQLCYGILCSASMAWDLRTSPDPLGRVGGLLPIYLLIGFLLYRFDLRFVAPAPPRATLERVTVTEPEPPQKEALPVPAVTSEGPAFAEVTGLANEARGEEPVAAREGQSTNAEAELKAEAGPVGRSEALPEPVLEGGERSEDPYDRYRPKR